VTDPNPQSRLVRRLTDVTHLPRLVGMGAATIALGLVFDASEHSFSLAPLGANAQFSAEQHLAHLVVLVGMVLVLAGAIADGISTSSRSSRQNRSPRHAVR
jgi:hypothetical protein